MSSGTLPGGFTGPTGFEPPPGLPGTIGFGRALAVTVALDDADAVAAVLVSAGLSPAFSMGAAEGVAVVVVTAAPVEAGGAAGPADVRGPPT